MGVPGDRVCVHEAANEGRAAGVRRSLAVAVCTIRAEPARERPGWARSQCETPLGAHDVSPPARGQRASGLVGRLVLGGAPQVKDVRNVQTNQQVFYASATGPEGTAWVQSYPLTNEIYAWTPGAEEATQCHTGTNSYDTYHETVTQVVPIDCLGLSESAKFAAHTAMLTKNGAAQVSRDKGATTRVMSFSS